MVLTPQTLAAPTVHVPCLLALFCHGWQAAPWQYLHLAGSEAAPTGVSWVLSLTAALPHLPLTLSPLPVHAHLYNTCRRSAGFWTLASIALPGQSLSHPSTPDSCARRWKALPPFPLLGPRPCRHLLLTSAAGPPLLGPPGGEGRVPWQSLAKGHSHPVWMCTAGPLAAASLHSSLGGPGVAVHMAGYHLTWQMAGDLGIPTVTVTVTARAPLGSHHG